ncbi:MAG TPA: TIGR03619 family F420-dependent LLM class oxidoreductase [Acidimicrobiia bacterium]
MTVNIVLDGTMPYGIQLPVQAKSVRTAMAWEREPGVGPAELVRAAKACDDAGFFYVAVCDHVQVPPAAANEGGMSNTWYDPVATLSYLAAVTTQTRLMTNVYVAAYRKPIQTAKHFATLDALSGGRVILGVGAGHLAPEFEGLGVRFDTRGKALDAAIDGVIDAWCSSEPQQPAPVQQPRPPVWIGGSGAPALRRVAERGDGWIPQGTPRKQMAESIDAIRAHRDKVRPDARLDIGYIHEYVYVGDAGWDFDGEYTVAGSDQRIVDKCNEMGAMGVNHLQVRLRARDIDEFCDQAAAFGERIGPHLVSAGAI